MMLPIVTGLLAGTIAYFPVFISAKAPQLIHSARDFVVLVGLLTTLPHFKSPFSGLSDFILTIHTPLGIYPPLTWAAKGITSLLLTCLGAPVGSEGAAAEFALAMNQKIGTFNSRWVEQKRRSDASVSLSAALAGALRAPFAGVFFPIELGIGGKILPTVLSATSSVIAFEAFERWIGPSRLAAFQTNPFHLPAHFQTWIFILCLAIPVGLAAVFFIKCTRLAKKTLKGINRSNSLLATLAGSVFLAYLLSLGSRLAETPNSIFHETFQTSLGANQLAFFLVCQGIALATCLSLFGTTGVFSPLLGLGGALGIVFQHLGQQLGSPFFGDLANPVIALACGSAFLGAVLGTPITASILIYEITHSLELIIPCLILSSLATSVRVWTGQRSLVEEDLVTQGLILREGKSLTILESILVRDAMESEFEVLFESDLLSEIAPKSSRYKFPFLPVVNAQGTYSGFLTLEILNREWTQEADREISKNISKLMEVKDLLYKYRLRCAPIGLDDPLSYAVGKFDEVPCVPVLDDANQVVGLLFNHGVRLAYDRELSKRSALLF